MRSRTKSFLRWRRVAAAAVDDVEIPQNFYNIQNDRINRAHLYFVVPQLFYTTLVSHVSILFSFQFFFISFVNKPFRVLFLLPALGICIHSRIGSASVLPLFIFHSSWRCCCLLTRCFQLSLSPYPRYTQTHARPVRKVSWVCVLQTLSFIVPRFSSSHRHVRCVCVFV